MWCFATVFWPVDAAVLMLAISTPVVLILAPVLVRRETIEVAGWRIDTTAEAWPASARAADAARSRLPAHGAGERPSRPDPEELLDPPEARLVAAVTELRRSRAGLVDAFEIERRRIEVDLPRRYPAAPSSP